MHRILTLLAVLLLANPGYAQTIDAPEETPESPPTTPDRPDPAPTTPVAPLPQPGNSGTLRVLTFNCQGLPAGIAAHRAERMALIAPAILALDPPPDVVCLQEVWVTADQQLLLKALADGGLTYGEGSPDALVVGSGLVFASRWPITHIHNEPYRVAGAPWFSDWWSRKGYILASIETPHGEVVIVNTHCHASYGNSETEPYRVAQLAQLATAVLDDDEVHSHPRLVCGDLNCQPGSVPFDLLAARLGLTATAADAGRIDHVLAADGLRVEHGQVALQDTVEVAPGVSSTLSDHAAWLADVTFTDRAEHGTPAEVDPALLESARESLRQSAATAGTRLWILLPVAALLAIGWIFWTFRRRARPDEQTLLTRIGGLFRWGAWLVFGLLLAVLAVGVVALMDLRAELTASGLL